MWQLDRVYLFRGIDGKRMTACDMTKAIIRLPFNELPERVEYDHCWQMMAVFYLNAISKRFGPDTPVAIIDDQCGGTQCDEDLWLARFALRTSRESRKIPSHLATLAAVKAALVEKHKHQYD